MPKIDFSTLFRFALCVIVAFSVGGCVVSGDEHGGIATGVTSFTLPEAMSEANSWCGRYGLVADETRMMGWAGGDMGFACVPPPGKPQ